MKQKRYWLRCGITGAIVNILLSIVAFNMPGIRHPESYSFFAIFMFPNFALAFPFLILIQNFLERLNSYFFSIIGQIGIDKDGAYLLFTLFIFLTIFWFVIGALLGFLYKKIKYKKITIQDNLSKNIQYEKRNVYWLTFGIYFSIFFIVFNYILSFFGVMRIMQSSILGNVFFIPSLILSAFDLPFETNIAVTIVVTLGFYFFIGAMIGLLYEKYVFPIGLKSFILKHKRSLIIICVIIMVLIGSILYIENKNIKIQREGQVIQYEDGRVFIYNNGKMVPLNDPK